MTYGNVNETWSDDSDISTTGGSTTHYGYYPEWDRWYTTCYHFWESCPKCSKLVESGDNYCRHCGEQLNPPKYCPQCGKKL